MTSVKLTNRNRLNKYFLISAVLCILILAVYLYFFVAGNVLPVFSPEPVMPRYNAGASDINTAKLEKVTSLLEEKNKRNVIDTTRDIFSKKEPQKIKNIMIPAEEDPSDHEVIEY